MHSAPAIVVRQLRRLRRLVFPALRRPDIVPKENTARGLDLLYRFILARPPDEDGRDYYLRLMKEDGLTLREVAAEIAASDEFQARLRDAIPPERTFIDARELNTTFTVEELARTADDYYRTTLEFSDRYLAKPFADPQDAPDLLGSFAQLVAGLRLAAGLDVLDFGAGACWTTRCGKPRRAWRRGQPRPRRARGTAPSCSCWSISAGIRPRSAATSSRAWRSSAAPA